MGRLIGATLTVLVAAGLLIVTLPRSAASAPAKLPALITLDGVAGVVPGLEVNEVERRWGVQLPVISSLYGSSSAKDEAIICAGRMEGAGYFPYWQLNELRFFRGARTDRGWVSVRPSRSCGARTESNSSNNPARTR